MYSHQMFTTLTHILIMEIGLNKNVLNAFNIQGGHQMLTFYTICVKQDIIWGYFVKKIKFPILLLPNFLIYAHI